MSEAQDDERPEAGSEAMETTGPTQAATTGEHPEERPLTDEERDLVRRRRDRLADAVHQGIDRAGHHEEDERRVQRGAVVADDDRAGVGIEFPERPAAVDIEEV